jgi:hypothetical protein
MRARRGAADAPTRTARYLRTVASGSTSSLARGPAGELAGPSDPRRTTRMNKMSLQAAGIDGGFVLPIRAR